MIKLYTKFKYLVLIFFLFINIQNIFATDITNGLVGNWDFNNCNAIDDTINQSNGIIYGNPKCVDGIKGKALKFDGVYSPDYVIVPNTSELTFNDNFTINLFFNISGDTSMNGWGGISEYGRQILLAKSGDRTGLDVGLGRGNDGLWYLGINNGRCCTNLGKGINSYVGMKLNEWHFMSVNIGGGYVRLYLDGILQGEMTTSDFMLNPSNANQNIQISIGQSAAWYPFNGIIDEVRVYNRALSSEETKEIYKNYTSFPETNLPEFINPLSYYLPISSSNNTVVSNDSLDPISLSTGDFNYSNTLLHLKGIGLDYDFKVRYSNQVSYDGPLGYNWSYSYNQMIYNEKDGNLVYLDENFSPQEFVKISDNIYENKILRATLSKNENNLYIISFDNGNKYSFNEFNKLSKIEDSAGNNLTFEYDNDKRLIKTTDTLGKEILYNYFDDSRLKEIITSNNKKVSFEYSETKDLIKIKLQDNKEIKFEYISGNNAEKLNHNISKLTDSKNQVYVENTYDENDRVISQKYGNDTGYYSYALDPTTSRVIKNNVTNRNGVKTEYSFDNKGNTISRKVETSNGIVEFKFEYDENGRVIKDTKSNGNSMEYSYDDKGRLLTQKVNGETTRITSYEYNSNFDTPTKITKPNGLVIENTLDDKGNATKSVVNNDSEKLETNYEYNDKGQLVQTISPRGLKTSLEYDGNGNVIRISKKDSSLLAVLSSSIDTSFEYDGNGNIIKTTDSNGNTRNITYNEFDQINKTISPEGITNSFEYDGNGNKTKQTLKLDDGSNLETSSSYDILDHILEINSPISRDLTAKIKYEYNANENVSKIIYPNGSTKELKYNEFDKVSEVKQEGIIRKYEYNNNGNIIKIIDDKGNFKVVEYNLFDEVVKIVDEVGTYTIFAYDNAGNVVKMEVYSRDSKLLSKQEKEYDKLGNITKQLNYNLANNQTLTTSYKFEKGLLVEKIDPKGNKTNLNYDIYGNNTEVIDSLGNKQVLSYDNNGNIISKKVIQSNSKTIETKYVFDKENNIITNYELLITNGVESQINRNDYKYNNLEQIIEKKDGNGNITKYEYNYIGKVTKKIETVNSKTIETKYEYDISGNLTAVIDGNGNKTGYVYDSLNRLIKEVYTDGKEVNYEYDSLGNIVKKTDPNRNIILNTYDSLNRLIERNITLGTGVEGVTKENYSYDELGRLISASDNKGNNLSFSYDSFDNLLSETNNGKEVKYSYDELGNLLNSIYPSSRNIGRTYDSIGRLTSIKNGNDVIKTYVYDGLEQTNEVNSNNTKTNYSYDELGRLKELTNISSFVIPAKAGISKNKDSNMQEGIINKYTFTYDNNSNILSNGQDSYIYDEINRLTNTTTSDLIFRQDDKHNSQISTLYNYDNVGNRDSVEQTTTWETKKGKEKEKVRIADYVSNNLNQYTQISSPLSSGVKGVERSGTNEVEGSIKNKKVSTFIYDNNGNLTNDGKQIYIYDYRNRLVKVNSYETDRKGKISTNLVAEFSYDILGRRTSKTTYNDEDEIKKIVRYTYSNQDVIQEDTYGIREGKEKLKDTKEYVYGKGVDDVLIVISSEVEKSNKNSKQSTYFYHKDQLGSIVAITDKDGKTVKEYRYDVFGKAYERNSHSDKWKEYRRQDIDNTRLFTGREYDKEIGLYYYRARYYSAELGRFINRDPIGQVDDVNLYSYVGNNVVNFVDSFGREKSLLNKFVSFNPISEDFLLQMGKEANQVAIYNSTPFIGGNTIPAHTEIIFFKDGKPIGQLGSAPLFGWANYGSKEATNFVNNNVQFSEKSDNVIGCINGLKNSLSNSSITGYGKMTICWHGAYDCYQGTKGNLSEIGFFVNNIGDINNITENIINLPLIK